MKNFNNSVAVSVVSHGQVKLLNKYLPAILGFKEINELIITHNFPEDDIDFKIPEDIKIQIITNKQKRGFAQNHNNAFKYSKSEYFCVLNPDISFSKNVFNSLLKAFNLNKDLSMLAPLVYDNENYLQDSFRAFPSFYRILKRKFSKKQSIFSLKKNKCNFFEPDWVAGMFMLFKSNVYNEINGFDTNFFLYCEDIDICLRLKERGYTFAVLTKTSIYHDARRKSRFDLYYTLLHMKSLLYLYFKYPKKIL